MSEMDGTAIEHRVIIKLVTCAGKEAVIILGTIVSNIGTSHYTFARYLAPIFLPFSANTAHNLPISFGFVNKLIFCLLRIAPHYHLKWKLSLIMFLLKNYYFNEIKWIPLYGYWKKNNLCVKSKAFIFRGFFYRQTEDGKLAVGNPLSFIVCDIYMHYYDEIILSKYVKFYM